MKPTKSVFVYRGLAVGIIILFIIAMMLQRRNKQLTTVYNDLLLQNDSILSVNLQLQKDIDFLKHDLDSIALSFPDKKLTAGK